MTSAFGILSFGAYLPRARMQRRAIAAANGWFAPGLKGQGKGERAIGNWDEDTITMAVEAARDCLGDTDRGALRQVVQEVLHLSRRLGHLRHQRKMGVAVQAEQRGFFLPQLEQFPDQIQRCTWHAGQ